ncbi:MAG TPA: sulfite exporter TauE/SafE family protein [Candidatus Bathyarchaeia archaeon]|nr:sulfite exporter TauE/SafE family protein [Candidatus Bathyarchaeia archaeon]
MNFLLGLLGLFFAGLIAGTVNSVAGGGTLIAFPSLVAFGETEIIANATNTAAIWTGSLSSAVGYRKDTVVDRNLLCTLLVPSLIGGLLGAFVLVITPKTTFVLVVPFLVLFATLLFASRSLFSRKFSSDSSRQETVSTRGRIGGVMFQFFVAIYGGYFGAGIGILMMASLSIMGLRDIHEINALKTPLGAVVNVTAFIFFALKGLVAWPLALTMAIGNIIGGYGGARLAKRVNQRFLAYGIVAIGLLVSAWLLTRAL